MTPLRYFTLVLLLIACAALSARADSNWTNPAGGNWSDPGNWDNGVPGASDHATITLSATYTVVLDTSATVFSVVLGGDSGTATLQLNEPLAVTAYNTFSGYAVQVLVRPHGALEIRDSLTIDQGNWGALSYGLWNQAGGVVRVDSTGSVTVVGVGAPGLRVFFENDGVTNVFEGSTMFGGFATNWGSLTIEGDLQVEVFRNGNGATVSVASSGRILIHGQFWGGGAAGEVRNNGTCNITTGGSITRVAGLVGSYTFQNNTSGEVHVYADSAHSTATIQDYISEERGGELELMIHGGNLALTDVSYLRDSVYIAPGCTLTVDSANFNPTASIAGGGTIHFASRTSTVQGAWYLTGGFLLSGLVTDLTRVNFNTNATPPVGLGSLKIATPTPVFTIDIGDTVVADTVTQNGGTINGKLVLGAVYNWNQGVLTTTAATEFAVPPGISLIAATGGTKTLDSLQLNIEGSAILQDSGLFTLVDSAVFNVAPGGTLEVSGGLAMTGVGTLYNSGQSTFDPAGDTIKIDVPLINSTVSRTPGTIDVLSTPVVLGSYGWNGAGFNLAAMSTLILNAQFRNASGGTMSVSGGRLVVNDTLWNEQFGQIDLTNGGEVSGAGVVMNGGDMSSSGGLLLTPTNNIISGSLINLPDSGFVNVLTDTLTVSGNVTNQDTITIQAGAVLKVLGMFLNDLSGVINGNGTLDVSEAISFINDGTISPGLSPGTLTVNGNLSLGPTSTLLLELRGPSPVDLDRLNVTGSIQLGGRLALSLQNGYIPLSDDSIQILACPNWSGQFASVTGTDLGNGQFLNLEFGPGGMGLSVMHGLSVVVQLVDSQAVRLFWQQVDGALSYTVYSDSALTGSFSTTQTAAADTSLLIPVAPGSGQHYFYVTATLP